MAQPWVLREILVDGHGNFGSVDGDPPAADRYTEAKLTPIADRLMTELRHRRCRICPTYDGRRDEPVVLPAQFPNVLVNGSSGIAVGMATNMPPHNLGEVIKAAVHLIDDKNATTAQLLDKLKGPDFPLGGRIITDRSTLRKIYEDGQGSIKVQAEWDVEEVGRKKQIVVTSIPYGVNKGNLENIIGEIIATKKLPQLLGLTNESNEKVGLRIAMEIKPDADPNLVMTYLYRHTQLQDNFPERSPEIWSTAGPSSAQAPTRLVERPRAGERTEDGDDRSLHGQPKAAPPLPLRRASMGERDGSPDDAHFPSRPSGDLVREQQHLRERRGEPVREAKVCVRFGHRSRDAAKPCRDDHSAGDEAACAVTSAGRRRCRIARQ